MSKNLPVCIDANAMDWTVSKAPKHKNTLLKILYDKSSGMEERVYYARVKPGGCIDAHAHPNTEVFYFVSSSRNKSISSRCKLVERYHAHSRSSVS